MEFIFKDEDLKILNFIKANTPNNIWNNFIEYIFDYDKFYFSLEIYCAAKFKLDNISEQYAMATRIKFVEETFQSEAAEMLCSNESILNIEMVRSLLVFEPHSEIKGTKNPSYSNGSFQINPELVSTSKTSNKCLVDIGLLLELKNKNLNCFILENDEDFSVNEFHMSKNFKQDKCDLYQFIKI
ncbi:hypothetical protein [Flavobacterium selenitireducens]|uniref:hypothetical protein n=1 Tax=Flavobacterium selenitireducens TaxID=2722704 RepID=UPI00168AC7A3|nr:hypothetical protein [Flavobacterium selenitireducens]MBD3581554.1 hypothetical protein [Flavobacterium selenitireducens]